MKRAFRGVAALLLACSTLVLVPGTAEAATIVTLTYSNPAVLGTFTVPDGVGSISVTMTGGQGGIGGFDSQGTLRPGGYRGLVTGVIAVTPGAGSSMASAASAAAEPIGLQIDIPAWPIAE